MDSYEIIKNSQGVANGIILVAKESIHRLAVVLVPPKTVCKIPTVKPLKDLPTVVIDLSEMQDFNHQKSQHVKSLLLESTQHKFWLTSPKIERWIEQRLQEQHNQYESWCEKQHEVKESRQKVDAVISNYRNHPLRVSVPKYGDNEELSAMRFYFTQQYPQVPTKNVVTDFWGERWVFCTVCNTWYRSQDMAIYGGSADKEINCGICRECGRNL